jgi:23S rRNA (guanosine2251-2'-O)-methyltransferase
MTGVLAKTASGAADVIPIATETNLSRAIELLQENGFVVIGLDERGDAIGDLPAHNRLALVLGAEGSGLRQNVAGHCNALVSLPTVGDIKSLNVSNAAAVALYATCGK